mmetsp:Transcript_51059/g.84777  ORF Transcript_51059/g.84777 Transcript_51059/m.84777 type:complete len:246 (-) Transcript_51059:24-761(-)
MGSSCGCDKSDHETGDGESSHHQRLPNQTNMDPKQNEGCNEDAPKTISATADDDRIILSPQRNERIQAVKRRASEITDDRQLSAEIAHVYGIRIVSEDELCSSAPISPLESPLPSPQPAIHMRANTISRNMIRDKSVTYWQEQDMNELELDMKQQLEQLSQVNLKDGQNAQMKLDHSEQVLMGSSDDDLPESSLFRVASQQKWTSNEVDEQLTQMQKEILHLAKVSIGALPRSNIAERANIAESC